MRFEHQIRSLENKSIDTGDNGSHDIPGVRKPKPPVENIPPKPTK